MTTTPGTTAGAAPSYGGPPPAVDPHERAYAPPPTYRVTSTRIPEPNPGVRTLVAVTGGLLALGAVTAMAAGSGRGGSVFESRTVEGTLSADQISTIVVNSGTMDMTIVPTDADEIVWSATLTRFPPSSDVSEIAVRNGDTVTFQLEPQRHALGFGGDWLTWGAFSGDQTLEVQIPSALLPDVVVNAGVGETTLSGNFAALTVNGGVGSLRLEGSAASLAISMGVGEVRALMDIDGGPVTVDGGVGSAFVDLGTTVAPGPIDLNGGVGEITVLLPSLSQGYSVRAEAGLGDVRNDAPLASADGVPVAGPVPVDASSGVGSVVLGRSLR